mgnify:CR=1 FL=1
MLFVKRKNCGQNLEYRQRPQVEGGNQDRQMLVKTEVLQFKERSFETFFYKYLSQSDTCQIESQKMKGACTKKITAAPFWQTNSIPCVFVVQFMV